MAVAGGGGAGEWISFSEFFSRARRGPGSPTSTPYTGSLQGVSIRQQSPVDFKNYGNQGEVISFKFAYFLSQPP